LRDITFDDMGLGFVFSLAGVEETPFDGAGFRPLSGLSPGDFTYELIDICLPRSVWSGEEAWIGADREGPGPKKGYNGLAGGY
jgi:hypothetical protein